MKKKINKELLYNIGFKILSPKYYELNQLGK